MKINAIESYDKSIRCYRRIYSLDNRRLCFLTFFLNDQRELKSISFDVEAADDYHYQISADEITKLCEALSCSNTEEDIAKAFTKLVESLENPIEIAEFLRESGIKYQVFHWY